MMKIKAIITGVTGMVGEGVLFECLQHPDVEQVLVVGRRSCRYTHEKLTEILLPDFFKIADIEDKLKGYNACFFCAGVSSVGMNKETYNRITHDLTLTFAQKLVDINPDLVFCYVSGAGTDSSEKGRIMWARVKGKTENDLLKLPFKQAYMFRPGYMKPTKGLKNTLNMYTYTFFLYPLFKLIFRKHTSTLKQVGLAMINIVLKGYEKPVLNSLDIIKLATD